MPNKPALKRFARARFRSVIAVVGLSSTSFTVCGCSNEAGTGKTGDQVARAPQAKPAVRAEQQVAPVSGEIFITTKAGDVKKGAGVIVYFVPVTDELKQTMASNIDKLNALLAEYEAQEEDRDAREKYKSVVRPSERDLEFGTEEYKAREANKKEYYAEGEEYVKKIYSPRLNLILKATDIALAKGKGETVADGDGKFKVELPIGVYLFWTENTKILRVNMVWCKVVKVRPSMSPLILDKRAVVLWEPQGEDESFEHPVSPEELLKKMESELRQ